MPTPSELFSTQNTWSNMYDRYLVFRCIKFIRIQSFYRTSVCNNPSYDLYLSFCIDIQNQERARTRCYVTHGIRVRVWLLVLLLLNRDTKKSLACVKTRGMVRKNALHKNTLRYKTSLPCHAMPCPTTLTNHNTSHHTTPHNVIPYHTTPFHTTPRCTALYYTALHCHTPHHLITSHHSILQYITVHYSTLHCTSLSNN